jgi:hypothetical protein
MLLDCGMVAKLVEAFDGYDVQDDQRFQVNELLIAH